MIPKFYAKQLLMVAKARMYIRNGLWDDHVPIGRPAAILLNYVDS